MAPTQQHNPGLTAILASAFTLAHVEDGAARRGADNAVRYLATDPILAFDPTESRALSEGGKDGTYYVTDGTHCTCKAKAWCKHGIAHRLKLAELALTDPAALVRLIIEQAVPPGADDFDAAAVGAAAAAIGQIVETPFDLTDDALYADLVAGVPLAPARPRAEIAMDELYPPR